MKTLALSVAGSLMIVFAFLSGVYVGQRQHRFTLIPDMPLAVDQVTGQMCSLRPASEVVMRAPGGEEGIVPNERVLDAASKGFTHSGLPRCSDLVK